MRALVGDGAGQSIDRPAFATCCATAGRPTVANLYAAALMSDYFVTISHYGESRVWRWEIHRRSSPLGIRIHEDGFNSPASAQLAGEKVLSELLVRLAQEGD
jgi:hypothetical protein